MSDAQVVALAGAIWVGAGLAWAVPLVPALVAVVLTRVRRRPLALIGAAFALALALGARADAGFVPVASTRFEGEVVLVGDPEPVGAVGQRAVVRLPDGRRVEATAHGAPGFELARHVVGERVVVTGGLGPLEDRPWTRSRHLLGRLGADSVTAGGRPALHWRVVERVRSLVTAGGAGLPGDERPLYDGLVVGDDRFQSDAQRARFRAAGLSHLLAVSGQNVAFVLGVARPAVRLVPRDWRPAVVGAVLVLFALVTRMEPSVLRATATAGLATVAASGGQRQSGVRLLALAVAALVLLDPFLIHAVGFQLSVAASAGILVLGPPLVARLPLPGPLAEPLSVTMAAQLGVLPLLLLHIGPVSSASIPANLAAGWAAGVVMTWGLTVGVVAGALPGPAAGVVQYPVHLLLVWLDGTARWAMRLPAPVLDGPVALLLGGGIVAVRALRRRVGGALGGLLQAGCVIAVGAVLASTVPAPPGRMTTWPGGIWIPAGPGTPAVLIVTDGDDDLVDTVLAQRITAIDVVVATAGSGRSGAAVAAVVDSVTVAVVLAPPRHGIVGAHRVTTPTALTTGSGTVVITPDDDRLAVEVR